MRAKAQLLVRTLVGIRRRPDHLKPLLKALLDLEIVPVRGINLTKSDKPLETSDISATREPANQRASDEAGCPGVQQSTSVRPGRAARGSDSQCPDKPLVTDRESPKSIPAHVRTLRRHHGTPP